MQVQSRQKGFTLVELMIVIVIMGVLVTVALPAYSNYVSRTRATAAMAELSALRTAVSICQAERGKLAGCDAGSNGVPNVSLTKNLTAVTVVSGVITATTAATKADGTALGVILTPTYTAGTANLIWANTGTVCDAKGEAGRGLKAGFGDC